MIFGIDIVRIHLVMLEMASVASSAMFLIWALRSEFRHLFKPQSIPAEVREPSHPVQPVVLPPPSPDLASDPSEAIRTLCDQMDCLYRIIAALEVQTVNGLTNGANGERRTSVDAAPPRKRSLVPPKKRSPKALRKGN